MLDRNLTFLISDDALFSDRINYIWGKKLIESIGGTYICIVTTQGSVLGWGEHS